MSMLLKDGPICIALIQQKDKTKYQSAFYDQSIHICIASSATLKKILKDDLQINNSERPVDALAENGNLLTH